MNFSKGKISILQTVSFDKSIFFLDDIFQIFKMKLGILLWLLSVLYIYFV